MGQHVPPTGPSLERQRDFGLEGRWLCSGIDESEDRFLNFALCDRTLAVFLRLGLLTGNCSGFRGVLLVLARLASSVPLFEKEVSERSAKLFGQLRKYLMPWVGTVFVVGREF